MYDNVYDIEEIRIHDLHMALMCKYNHTHTHTLLCIMRTNVFGPNFQGGKKSFLLIN